MKLNNNKILLFILLVAAALRFFNYFQLPFTHDEFSVLFRLQFDNFKDLIEFGVMKPDTHPAGIQVFVYYWTKLFGTSEWVMKLPFMCFGLISIWLIYIIAKQWFNESVGLVSAAFMASIQYTIMYSQIARPYISGLFFSLLMVYFWTRLIRNPEKKFYLNSVFFILSAALCAYNHYFSLLFAIVVGFSGVFLIQKKNLLRYILSGAAIFVLFLPHFKIFLFQFSQGGVEGWLAKPTNSFLFDYIQYVFNYSAISLSVVLLIILIGARNKEFLSINLKTYMLFVSWFLLPFLIGFFYSKYVNSVLQFSVLIFSFPYLLFILFGHIKEQKVLTNFLLVALILFVNTFSLISTRKHYDIFYKSIYKHAVTDFQSIEEEQDKCIPMVFSHPKINKYYMSELEITDIFVDINSFRNEIELKGFLKQESKDKDFLYLGCHSSIQPGMVQVIREFYPSVIWRNNYFGGDTYLFSKDSASVSGYSELLDFELIDSPNWHNVSPSKIIDTTSFSGKYSYIINNEIEWGPTFEQDLNNLIGHENDFIYMSLRVKPINGSGVILVTSLESKGQNIYWSGANLNDYNKNVNEEDGWCTIYKAIKLSDINQDFAKIRFKCFVWNKEKADFLIDDFRIEAVAGNPLIYSLYERI